MTVDLVLARMNEPMDWLTQIKPSINVVIYCFKDPPVLLPRPASCVNIPDAGQEAGAYAHHIVTRYDSLADVTIFSQADPSPHINGTRSFVQMAHCIAEGGLKTGFEFIGDRCLSSAHDPLARRVHLHHTKSPLINYSKTPLKDACKYLLDSECPESIEHPFGAIFAASRQAIQKHPLEFWRRLHVWCAHSPKTHEAAILEKLWPTLLA